MYFVGLYVQLPCSQVSVCPFSGFPTARGSSSFFGASGPLTPTDALTVTCSLRLFFASAWQDSRWPRSAKATLYSLVVAPRIVSASRTHWYLNVSPVWFQVPSEQWSV